MEVIVPKIENIYIFKKFRALWIRSQKKHTLWWNLLLFPEYMDPELCKSLIDDIHVVIFALLKNILTTFISTLHYSSNSFMKYSWYKYTWEMPFLVAEFLERTGAIEIYKSLFKKVFCFFAGRLRTKYNGNKKHDSSWGLYRSIYYLFIHKITFAEWYVPTASCSDTSSSFIELTANCDEIGNPSSSKSTRSQRIHISICSNYTILVNKTVYCLCKSWGFH